MGNLLKHNFVFFLLGCLSLWACRPEVKNLKGRRYTITGEVANCEGCAVKLQLYDYNLFKSVAQTPIKTDSVRNGNFKIKGQTTRAGFYEVHLTDKHTGRPMVAIIYLPADRVQIKVSPRAAQAKNNSELSSRITQTVNYPPYATLEVTSSSAVQADINEFLFLQDSMITAYLAKEKATYVAFRATFTSGNRRLINAWADSVRLIPEKYPVYKSYAADIFIKRHPHSEVAILAMLENHHERTTNFRFSRYFNALPRSRQFSYYGQLLARKLNIPNKPAKSRQHWVGSSITYLKGSTPAGQKINVKQIFNQNQYTLLTFWASWHAPSRAPLPAYQALYQQYQPQGLEIIAVSFDQSYAAWTQAIAAEGLTFRQVSELKGENAEEYRRFRIRDMPFNILFDQQGTMVAVDVTPQELAQKLRQSL